MLAGTARDSPEIDPFRIQRHFRSIHCNSLTLMRSESTAFTELSRLCVSDGYIHALATICANNALVRGIKPYAENDISNDSPPELTNTEIMTLVGLIMKGPISFNLPSPKDCASYIDQSYALLHEIHRSVTLSEAPSPYIPTFTTFRELIFYSGDSAYHFQYSHLAPLKYKEDSDWLLNNKNIDLKIGEAVCQATRRLLEERLAEALIVYRESPPEKRSLLGAFRFSLEDLGFADPASAERARDFVMAFSVRPGSVNGDFNSITDFNMANARPIIRRSDNEFILLSQYCLTQAFYESPFYWMFQDQRYRNTAANNRGRSTEAISVGLLERVFSADHIFKNVQVLGSKGNILGEIDVLVVYGNFVFILQAKSKRLTVKARTGNNHWIEEDFNKAVQEAAEQAFACAKLIGKRDASLRIGSEHFVLPVKKSPYVIPVTVLLDHYPALLFQTRFLLQKQFTPCIASPLVTDVFALDTMVELLDSPLRFLHYLIQRERNPDLLLASQEHELLGLYLVQGLAFEEDATQVIVSEDISYPDDLAMCVRRDGAKGPATPRGIHDQLAGTLFGSMLAKLAPNDDPTAVNLGLVLLELPQSSIPILELNGKVEKCVALFAAGVDHCPLSFILQHLSTGVTIMCASGPNQRAAERLDALCTIRKYAKQLLSWFGILLDPGGEIVWVLELTWPWRHEPDLDLVLNDPRCP